MCGKGDPMARITLDEKFQLEYLRAAKQELTKLHEEMAGLCTPKSASHAATNLVKIRFAREELQELMDGIDELDRTYCREILPEIYEKEDDVRSITALDYRVTKTESVKASTVKKDTAIEWLEANGYEDIIDREPRINSQTLNAFARTLMEDGGELPEDIFNVYTFSNASITRSPKK
jgi:hypothetical protein